MRATPSHRFQRYAPLVSSPRDPVSEKRVRSLGSKRSGLLSYARSTCPSVAIPEVRVGDRRFSNTRLAMNPRDLCALDRDPWTNVKRSRAFSKLLHHGASHG